ncbi:hypothetical protein ACH5RR_026946 [Cinchona calisaya]|uniref:Uncharacterized protein n=1 Tax=Cinchona calisaya TaxID=153742 RepID=A0ABD2Z423_9GENT
MSASSLREKKCKKESITAFILIDEEVVLGAGSDGFGREVLDLESRRSLGPGRGRSDGSDLGEGMGDLGKREVLRKAREIVGMVDMGARERENMGDLWVKAGGSKGIRGRREEKGVVGVVDLRMTGKT